MKSATTWLKTGHYLLNSFEYSILQPLDNRFIDKIASSMMALSSSSNAITLTENDVPGASLLGRKPEELSNSELKFWLKCRGDTGKGLKTKAELV